MFRVLHVKENKSFFLHNYMNMIPYKHWLPYKIKMTNHTDSLSNSHTIHQHFKMVKMLLKFTLSLISLLEITQIRKYNKKQQLFLQQLCIRATLPTYFSLSYSTFHPYILELLQIKLEVLVHLNSSLVNGCVEL